MRDSFVFYKSFLTSINMLPASTRLEAYEGLARCGLGEITPDELKYPVNALVAQMIASVKAAQERHDKAEEDGKRGGRPRKWVDREEAEKLYSELKSWDKVADELNVDRKTLYRARVAWGNLGQKGKNLNVNDNVNGNVNVNDNYQLTNDISLCYGDYEISVKSVDDAMTTPFVDGYSISEICDDIEVNA